MLQRGRPRGRRRADVLRPLVRLAPHRVPSRARRPVHAAGVGVALQLVLAQRHLARPAQPLLVGALLVHRPVPRRERALPVGIWREARMPPEGHGGRYGGAVVVCLRRGSGGVPGSLRAASPQPRGARSRALAGTGSPSARFKRPSLCAGRPCLRVGDWRPGFSPARRAPVRAAPRRSQLARPHTRMRRGRLWAPQGGRASAEAEGVPSESTRRIRPPPVVAPEATNGGSAVDGAMLPPLSGTEPPSGCTSREAPRGQGTCGRAE